MLEEGVELLKAQMSPLSRDREGAWVRLGGLNISLHRGHEGTTLVRQRQSRPKGHEAETHQVHEAWTRT